MSTDAAADWALIAQQVREVLLIVTASPKPSYSVDGQSVSWADYLMQLRLVAAYADEMLAKSQGPYMELTTLVT